MSDTPTHDDHWRRLASELGLDVGPEPEQPPPATEPEMRAAEPDTERPRSHRRPEPPDDEPVEAAQEPFEPAEPEPPARGRRGRVTAAEEETSLFEAETVPPAEAEIEGSDVEAAAVPEVRPEAAEEASEEVAEEQAGKRRRRRRSRRKKKGGEATTDAATAEEPAAEEPPAESTSDDDEEPVAEVVTNWNVPSWDELIASLHRPER